MKVSRIISYNPHIKKDLFNYGVKFLEFQKLILTELEKAYLFVYRTDDKEVENAIVKKLKEIEAIS